LTLQQSFAELQTTSLYRVGGITIVDIPPDCTGDEIDSYLKNTSNDYNFEVTI
jgi:hypothetical protein